MIKIFSQYSYGGFKTLSLEGVENELLGPKSEVTFDNNHGFPQDAQRFFQFGGCKMIYLKLSSGEFSLVVREIPSNDVDGAGRAISCAVQFIGQKEDRRTLDNMALIIANDVVGFGTFFANLFYVRQGLHIEGEKIRNFIDECSSNIIVEGETHPSLLSISKKQQGVFLFVPLSEKFGIDRDVTNHVSEELKLKKNELKGSVVSMKELNQIQNKLKIVSLVQKISTGIIKPISHEESDNNIREFDEKVQGNYVEDYSENPVANPINDNLVAVLESEIQKLKKIIVEKEKANYQQVNELSKKHLELQSILKRKIDECETVSNKLGFYKKVVYVLAATTVTFVVAFFVNCSH